VDTGAAQEVLADSTVLDLDQMREAIRFQPSEAMKGGLLEA